MKQFLLKTFEVIQRLFRVSLDIGNRLFVMLRDPPRAVILCITLQLIIAISLLIAFHNRRGSSRDTPAESQIEPQTTQPTEPPDVLRSVEHPMKGSDE
jgi:hypothetical protein